MDIRQAVAADIASICELDHLASREERSRFIDEVVTAGSAWVAVIEDRVAGYVVLEYSFYRLGFISMLYVRAGLRRRAVGTALMGHVESLCRTEKLFTSTNESNRPMRALLAARGYSPSGVINNLDDDDPEIVYLKAR